MARLPRVAIPDLPHHVTQRGNARQLVFAHDSDRATYLQLLRQYFELYKVALLGYCLMSNHVHLIAMPRTVTALADALRHTHGRYATYWNARLASSGHVWQGRFYSCPLDESHLWEALRYVELNPVRARMVANAEQWKWSSATAHGAGAPDGCLDTTRWQAHWSPASWRDFLAAGEPETVIAALRRSTHTGRPLGTPAFVAALEKSTLRQLAPRQPGRPARPALDSRQSNLAFIA
ncbi:MAG TPA: transposase [Terriglobales bacterium]|jgi:putative transposase|nr:transposase [Terriglobales bacterium]